MPCLEFSGKLGLRCHHIQFLIIIFLQLQCCVQALPQLQKHSDLSGNSLGIIPGTFINVRMVWEYSEVTEAISNADQCD